jgi:hypothetical protein
MVDVNTHKLMHHDDNESPTQREHRELNNEISQSDQLPQGNSLLMLPATINGYGFHDKKWRTFTSIAIAEHYTH